MLVVSDTTPIITLMKCHQLEILKKLFKEIIIPEAVYKELTSLGILKLANKKGLLSGAEVMDCIEALRSNARHISEDLIQIVLGHIKE